MLLYLFFGVYIDQKIPWCYIDQKISEVFVILKFGITNGGVYAFSNTGNF